MTSLFLEEKPIYKRNAACYKLKAKQHANLWYINAPVHDETYNKTCATSEDSDQPTHPCLLISVLVDRICLLHSPGCYKRTKRGPLLYWTDVQADLTCCWLPFG